MNKHGLSWIAFLTLILVTVSVACQAAAPTAAPTGTPVPPTATSTLAPTTTPTSTPLPTATPNLAATQQIEERETQLQSYVEAGYIPAASGKFEELMDFHQEWPQLHWYQWWPIHTSVVKYADLVFQGRFQWESASRSSDLSGCGVLFGIQSNGDHYAVFIDKSRVAFMMSRGGQVYQVGKTRGSGRLSIQEPADADVTVIVKGAKSYVIVNRVSTEYTLSADQSSAGEFALSLLSGTNKDFGTRCDITNAYLWTPGE